MTNKQLSLTAAQFEAVHYNDGPILIVAGAGTGKTTVIIEKIKYLVNTDIAASRILAITFTNKAATEIRHRLSDTPSDEGPFIGTFHAFANHFIQKYQIKMGKPRLGICDKHDQINLIATILKSHKRPHHYDYAARTALSISKLKANGRIDTTMAAPSSKEDQQLLSVLHNYQGQLTQNNRIDFDDMINQLVNICEQDPDYQQNIRSQFDYILIDEYQDINLAQYKLMSTILGHHNICVVGDFDQTIYAWRGASVQHLLDFEDTYPNAKVVYLEDNFRSSQTILDSANHLIAHNQQRKPKTLNTTSELGSPTQYVVAYDESDEANYIARKIQELTRFGPYSHNDIAVLYRLNQQSKSIEAALTQKNIPFTVAGDDTPYTHPEIRAIMGYIQLAFDPKNNHAFESAIKYPARGIGGQTLEILMTTSAQHDCAVYELMTSESAAIDKKTMSSLRDFFDVVGSLSQMIKDPKITISTIIDAVLESSGYDASLKRRKSKQATHSLNVIAAFKSDVSTLTTGIEQFVTQMAFLSDPEQHRNNAMHLMTLHHAKGLEFPVVFIVGMDEMILPYYLGENACRDLEEERRLAYVGITRAKKELYLTSANQRRFHGSTWQLSPSRFISELPRDGYNCQITEYLNDKNGAILRKLKEEGIVYSVLSFSDTTLRADDIVGAIAEGDAVSHSTWGQGVVTRIDGEGDSATYEIKFKGETRKLIAKYANVTKVP